MAAGWCALALTGYVELMRGTPILLQLFVLYYGLAAAIRLPAFVAALLGLALNYAAYESEIYRSALEAIPTGQLEAARTLGLSERQVLTLVRGPQAFRLALAPMTNDFVALLKDSSLVSVLTVLELTKQTQIFATNLGSWVIPGTLCAALYLAMSLPLAALARRLERDGRRRRDERPVAAACATCICSAAPVRFSPASASRSRAASSSRSWGRPAPARRRSSARSPASKRFDAGPIAVDGVALDGGAASPPADASRAPPKGRHGVSVPLPVRAPVGDRERLPRAGARVRRGGAGRAATRALELLAAFGVEHRADGAAARALRRRGPARRHRPRAGGRSAAAADGRADGVARSGAAGRARRAAAGAAATAAARSSSPRTTRTSRASGRRVWCGCATVRCPATG